VLQNKTVFITGASAGIGAALARQFAAHGANLVLTARRRDRLDALAAELGGRVRVLALTADVTRDGELDAAAEQAERALGSIDVVVANAGFAVTGPLARLALDDYRRQFETNVFGVLRTITATLPALKRARGRLALMGSVAGHVPTPATSPYNMSKFAVRALAECLHEELRVDGVTVTLLSPGFVVSELGRVDNQGRLRERDALRVPGWLRMPTEQAARQMVAAIDTGRREALITRHAKLGVFLYRHVPWLVNAALRAGGQRLRSRGGDPAP
jgi:short-subunit dehydrogenase